MACVKCNGVWQCSVGDDPCDMSHANEPLKAETHCFQIYTKEKNSGCDMRVKADGNPPNGDGWQDAGNFCVKFELFKDANTGECFVQVTPGG